MKLTNIILYLLLAVVITGCGTCEKYYDDDNYESNTNEHGILTLWSGSRIMAIFSAATIIYSASDSEAMYFKDKKGSAVVLRGTDGDTYTQIGDGDTWYTSPGVLMKLD